MSIISIIKNLSKISAFPININKSILIIDPISNKILKLAKSYKQITQNLPNIIQNSLSNHKIKPSIISIQTKDNQSYSIILLKKDSNVDVYELNDFIQNYNSKISNLTNLPTN